MRQFRFAPLLLVAIASPALAQDTLPPPQPAVPAAPAPRPATVAVSLLTADGPIIVELEKERAPITTANFLRYVDARRFDGIAFYRAVAVPNMPELGLVQAGVNNDPRKLFPTIPHEPTTKTGILHTDGTISMARNAPGTAAGDFFIVLGTQDYMNANPVQPGDNLGYAAFGHVIQGIDIVKKMLAAPRSDKSPSPAMKGQMLASPVKIISARRVKPSTLPAESEAMKTARDRHP